MELNLDYYKESNSNTLTEVEQIILNKINSNELKNYEELLDINSTIDEIKIFSENRKNIISWYPIEETKSVLEIGGNFGELTEEFLNKTKNVTVIEAKKEKAEIIAKKYKDTDITVFAGRVEDIELEKKYDYVSLIGINEDEFNEKIDFAKAHLKENGKILLAVNNKIGIRYYTGIDKENNQYYIDDIKEVLEKDSYETKIYYPLPDYTLANAIYTDEYLPNVESINSRDLYYYDYTKQNMNFSERDAIKEIINVNPELFKYFTNSYFIVASKKLEEIGVKHVTYSSLRKTEYRIKTVIGNENVYKTANNDKAIKHIENIEENIDILKESNIETLDSYSNKTVISNYVESPVSLDKIIINKLKANKKDEAIEIIKKFKQETLDKLEKTKEPLTNNIFKNLNIIYDENEIKKLTFIKEGLIDLIFQNTFVVNDKYMVYDQEWKEENVPIEYIIYRGIIYLSEIREYININELFDIFGITKYLQIFQKLEENFQIKTRDEIIWKLHATSDMNVGMLKKNLEEYRNKLINKNNELEEVKKNMEKDRKTIEMLNDAIKKLEEKTKELEVKNRKLENETKVLENETKLLEKQVYDKEVHIQNLNCIINSKDIEIGNANARIDGYENQLRVITNSLSWKITKPLRYVSWILTPNQNVGFMERILPGGSRMRIKYDEKMAKKKEEKKLNGYHKATDDETVEYWKGIEHRENLRRERVFERINNGEILSNYEYWQLANDPTLEELEMQAKTKFKKKPKISITIPLYNTDTDFFRELIFNLYRQTYKNWELCLADGSKERLTEIEAMCKDKRIKYKFLDGNLGIAGNTNEALKMATGDYITLLDHDDLLPVNALYEIVKCINENPDVDFIYTDEDKFQNIDELRYEPHFKPDYAPDTLRANNYICHYSVFKKELLNKIGLFNSNYDGAQDFDIILRATENAGKIIHIPKILYHWRVHKNSTAMAAEAKPYAFESGIHAVEAHLERVGLKGKVSHGATLGTYKVDYEVEGNPKVSIIIPNKDGKDILKVCIESILEKTTYENYEIVIVENNSETKEIFKYYKELQKNKKIKVVEYPNKGFNYSSIINFGVKNSEGEYIVQLNNDTELRTEDWLEKMLGFCQREDVGAVGVKLYYPDNTIQHAGIIVGALTVAAHVFRGVPDYTHGYFGRDSIIQNMNAVTAACIMTKKEIYEEVGFMNEEFAVAFNDIDFCLRIRNTGKLIVYNPFVEFTHFESKTRGNDLEPEKIERFKGEINLFLTTWKEKLDKGDEYYNKNFSLESDQYEIRKEKV